jgi:hypothetical protein
LLTGVPSRSPYSNIVFGNEWSVPMWYVWVPVFGGLAAIIASTAYALRSRPRVAAAAGLGWTAWAVVAALLADAGAFGQRTGTTVPWIVVGAGGALVAAVLAGWLPPVRRALDGHATAAWLIWPQTARLVGGVFLIVLALGELPAIFAVPAGAGDLAVGLAAPFVARRLTMRRGVMFNLLGMLDLTVAVTIGYLAGLGSSRVLDVTPSTAVLGTLPLVMIPVAAVPLVFALHIVSLRGLLAQRRAAAPAAPAGGRAPAHAEAG